MSTKMIDEHASARDRLLAAADELFYEEGVNTVGIDRIIERAGVAKASLYSAFGSKDELIRAYLSKRHEARQARITTKLQRYSTPREQLLAIFDVLGEIYADPKFRGCAFIDASAEAKSGSAVEAIVDEARAWTNALFVRLSRQAGAKHPEQLGQQLRLLYDGATIGAKLDHNPKTALTAKRAAAILIDAAVDA